MLFKNDSCLRTVDGGLRRILYKFKERDRDVPCPEAPLGVNEFSPASQAHSLLHHHSGKGTGGVRIDGNVDLAFAQRHGANHAGLRLLVYRPCGVNLV